MPFATIWLATPLPFTFAIFSDFELTSSGRAGTRTEAGGELIFNFLTHLQKVINDCGLQQTAEHDLDLGAMAAIQGYEEQEEDR